MAEQPSASKDGACASDQASGVPETNHGSPPDTKAESKIKKKKTSQMSPGTVSPAAQPPTVSSDLSVCSMPYTHPPSTLTSPASGRKSSIPVSSSLRVRQTSLALSPQSPSLPCESLPHDRASPCSPLPPRLPTAFQVPYVTPISTSQPPTFSAPPFLYASSTSRLPHSAVLPSAQFASFQTTFLTTAPTVTSQALSDTPSSPRSSLRSQGCNKPASAVSFAGDEVKDVTNVGVTSDEVLGHGLFQLRILAFVQVSTGMLAFDRLSISLLAPPIGHWCKPPPEFGHMNSSQWKNHSIPILDDGFYSQCGMYVTTGNDSGAERTVVPCTAWIYDVAEDVKTIVNEWDLVCGAQWTVSLLHAYHLLGALVTLPFLGQVSDKIGRKPVICGCATLAVGSMMVALLTARLVSFFSARLITAAGLGPLKMILLILLFESSEGIHRFYYYSFAEAGSVLATLVESALEHWILDRRLVCFLALVPASSFVAVFLFLEESPMWLLATWDLVRGEKVARFAARVNGAHTNIIGLIRKHTRAIKRAQVPQRAEHVLNLVALPSLRLRMLALCWIWLSLFIAKFCLSTFIEKTLNLAHAAMEVVPILSSMLASILLLEGFERKSALRLALQFTCGLSGVLSVGAALFPEELQWIVRELTFCSIFTTITLVHVYSMEMFPTVIRATGISLVYFCGRLGALIAMLLEFLSERTYPSVSGLVTSALIFSCLFLIRYLPETKDVNLFDTM